MEESESEFKWPTLEEFKDRSPSKDKELVERATLDWYNNVSLVRCESIDALKSFVDDLSTKTLVANDIETTGLNSEKDQIVGISLSGDVSRGMYIPLRHRQLSELNMDPDEVYSVLEPFFKAVPQLFYNGKFDASFYEDQASLVIPKWEDACISCYMVNTNRKTLGLKAMMAVFLGNRMLELTEVTGAVKDFSAVAPDDLAVRYAAGDSVGTLMLHQFLEPIRVEQPLIYRIEVAAAEVVRRIERNRVLVDVGYCREMWSYLDRESRSVRAEIYAVSKREFDIDSPKQVGEVLFDQLGIKSLAPKKAKSGLWDTSADHLEKLASQHKVCALIMSARSLGKFKSTYAEPFIEAGEDARGVKFCFHNLRAPCLTEDAYLCLKSGSKSIRDVRAGDVIRVESGWDEVAEWCEVGESECYRVATRSHNVLEGTGHHPVRLLDRDCGLSEVRVGDQFKPIVGVHFPEEKEVHIPFEFDRSSRRATDLSKIDQYGGSAPDHMSSDLARMIGFIAGDGSISKDGVKLCFREGEDEFIEYYVSMFERLHSKKRPALSVGDDHTVQVKFSSVLLRDFYRLVEAKADKVPDVIQQSGYILQYLMGYLDSDGCCTIRSDTGKPDIKLCSIAKRRLWELFVSLRNLGFDVGLNRKCGDRQWNLRVHLAGVGDLFSRDIPFGWEYIREFGASCRKSLGEIVTSVSSIGVRKVYDIRMKRDPWFVVGGLLTHNTGRMASGGSDPGSGYGGINAQAIPNNYGVKMVKARRIKSRPGMVVPDVLVPVGRTFLMEDVSLDTLIEVAGETLRGMKTIPVVGNRDVEVEVSLASDKMFLFEEVDVAEVLKKSSLKGETPKITSIEVNLVSEVTTEDLLNDLDSLGGNPAQAARSEKIKASDLLSDLGSDGVPAPSVVGEIIGDSNVSTQKDGLDVTEVLSVESLVGDVDLPGKVKLDPMDLISKVSDGKKVDLDEFISSSVPAPEVKVSPKPAPEVKVSPKPAPEVKVPPKPAPEVKVSPKPAPVTVPVVEKKSDRLQSLIDDL